MSLVKLIPSRESTNTLNDYLQQIRLPPKNEFHTTLLYTQETPSFETPEIEGRIRTLLPIILDPATYYLQIFGSGDLVLRYDNQLVERISDFLVEETLRQCVHAYSEIRTSEEGVPDPLTRQHRDILERHVARRRTSPIYCFNPHITLRKNFHGKPESLAIPRFPVVMERIDWDENF